jgi:hypothetical protein
MRLRIYRFPCGPKRRGGGIPCWIAIIRASPLGTTLPPRRWTAPIDAFSRDQGFPFQTFDRGQQTLFIAPLR